MKITFSHLSKTFKNRAKGMPDVTAVDDFDFEMPSGKLIALLGPSGCGKSTALNLICGLETPTGGRIFFDGDDVTDTPPERRGVGMVFQNYALYPHLTVRQNIMFPLENLRGSERLTKEQMEEKVAFAAKLVEVETLLDRRPSEMSGGQQQRVAIARALVKVPRVLLLDEPLSNLDARLRLQTREEIRRIQRETGVTTVFVTHDQEEAMSISDMIIVMKEGKIQQIGAPQTVYDDPENLFVAKFLGTPEINVFDAEVNGGSLYVGGAAVLETNAADGEYFAAVRPEGFIINEGSLECEFSALEVMGRETSVVFKHSAAQNPACRAIISSGAQINQQSGIVRFALLREKTFLFDKSSGERVAL